MPTAKDSHSLTTYYIKQCKEKYGTEPNVNRHSARWGFDAVLMGMDIPAAKSLVDYFLSINNHKDLTWFFYNYEKLMEAREASIKDTEHRRKVQEESRARAEKWRNSGQRGITSFDSRPTE